MSYRHISALFHGDYGSGKSFAAGGFPGPALVFDCEGGFRDVPGLNRIPWNPRTEPVPEFDPDDEPFIMVDATEWATINAAYLQLQAGKIAVDSVIFDSITEMQRQLQAQLASSHSGFDYWRAQLDTFTNMIRTLRDRVRRDEINLCIVCSSDFETVKVNDQKGASYTKAVPLLQGALRKQIAGFFDVFGFFEIDEDTGNHLMWLKPAKTHSAKCRLHKVNLAYPHGAMPASIDPPTVVKILDLINDEGTN